MKQPSIELIPLCAAIASDQPTTLDLLVKIIPPFLETDLKRPPLNLGLVLDRSGSMSGEKIEFARQAASYAVQQLLPTDWVSVTIFDDRVETLVRSTLVENKEEILQQIQRVQVRGTTALHAGWVEGGIQVSQHLRPNQLNRVILLSDGLANVGETQPDAIASDVHGLAQRGVSTTAMGVGDDYDENLLEAMARSGDGNFYHIESPQQLPAIFLAELQGLMATVGHKVSLGVEPENGVTVVDVLNDLDRTCYERLKLPNLVVGHSIAVVLRLKVPPLAKSCPLCTFRLAWDNPEQPSRQVLRVVLELPVVKAVQLTDFPLHPEVQEQVALLMGARARQEFVQHLDSGDYEAAKRSLHEAKEQVACAPLSPTMLQEGNLLDDLEEDLEANRTRQSRKKAIFQSYNRRRSRDDA